MKVAIEAETDEEKKQVLKQELEKHHRKAEKGYSTLKEDKEKAQKSWERKHRLPNATNTPSSVDSIDTSNKKHFMKNVKECRDVIVKKVLEQGWYTRTTHYTCWTYDTLHRCHQLHDLYCLFV